MFSSASVTLTELISDTGIVSGNFDDMQMAVIKYRFPLDVIGGGPHASIFSLVKPPEQLEPILVQLSFYHWASQPSDTDRKFLKTVPYLYSNSANGDRYNSCQVIYSQFGSAIHQNDHQARRTFVKWAQNEIVVLPDFHKRILFSDEAHFGLNGYVNKQNCRIWSEANPQVYVETPLHPEKLTVWCALWAGGIIGPYFFKNDENHNVTVNGDRYRAMITNFFIPELNNHDVQELWF
ncbi:putative DD41D transposase [Trichonephila clavipes]|nr:putative DD41D transposase [Trichonephila clavipes]